MLKIIGAFVALMFVVSCSSDFFGAKMEGKAIKRGLGYCAWVSGLDVDKITSKKINCLCVVGPTTPEERADALLMYFEHNYGLVGDIYLARDITCDPKITDEELDARME
ncbi:MAG: hypothetical protein WC523_04605 [Patescibacteria group bacterium]